MTSVAVEANMMVMTSEFDILCNIIRMAAKAELLSSGWLVALALLNLNSTVSSSLCLGSRHLVLVDAVDSSTFFFDCYASN